MLQRPKPSLHHGSALSDFQMADDLIDRHRSSQQLYFLSALILTDGARKIVAFKGERPATAAVALPLERRLDI